MNGASSFYMDRQHYKHVCPKIETKMIGLFCLKNNSAVKQDEKVKQIA